MQIKCKNGVLNHPLKWPERNRTQQAVQFSLCYWKDEQSNAEVLPLLAKAVPVKNAAMDEISLSSLPSVPGTPW